WERQRQRQLLRRRRGAPATRRRGPPQRRRGVGVAGRRSRATRPPPVRQLPLGVVGAGYDVRAEHARPTAAAVGPPVGGLPRGRDRAPPAARARRRRPRRHVPPPPRRAAVAGGGRVGRGPGGPRHRARPVPRRADARRGGAGGGARRQRGRLGARHRLDGRGRRGGVSRLAGGVRPPDDHRQPAVVVHVCHPPHRGRRGGGGRGRAGRRPGRQRGGVWCDGGPRRGRPSGRLGHQRRAAARPPPGHGGDGWGRRQHADARDARRSRPRRAPWRQGGGRARRRRPV
ncbi:hypothetical protein BU14_0356s0007, partial [Porphyra umbilicalis]